MVRTLENNYFLVRTELEYLRCNESAVNFNPLMPGGNKKVTQT